ncbi:Putative uncharacterized protein [Moritella viscosa]|nr:Putative uncharacterized protein [Moritella viscosa]
MVSTTDIIALMESKLANELLLKNAATALSTAATVSPLL